MRSGSGKAWGETSISMDTNGTGKALDTMQQWHCWRTCRTNDFTVVMRAPALGHERKGKGFEAACFSAASTDVSIALQDLCKGKVSCQFRGTVSCV